MLHYKGFFGRTGRPQAKGGAATHHLQKGVWKKKSAHPPRPSHAGGEVRPRACRAGDYSARRPPASPPSRAHCHDCAGPARARHRPPPHPCTQPCTQLTVCATGAAIFFSAQHGRKGGSNAQQPTPAARPPASEPRRRGTRRARDEQWHEHAESARPTACAHVWPVAGRSGGVRPTSGDRGRHAMAMGPAGGSARRRSSGSRGWSAVHDMPCALLCYALCCIVQYMCMRMLRRPGLSNPGHTPPTAKPNSNQI